MKIWTPRCVGLKWSIGKRRVREVQIHCHPVIAEGRKADAASRHVAIQKMRRSLSKFVCVARICRSRRQKPPALTLSILILLAPVSLFTLSAALVARRLPCFRPGDALNGIIRLASGIHAERKPLPKFRMTI